MRDDVRGRAALDRAPLDRALLDRAERNRMAAFGDLSPKRPDVVGQFFTPARAASLIASMPRMPAQGRIRVLDPGAGTGMLSAALVARALDECPDLAVHIVAIDSDDAVLPYSRDTLEACAAAGDGRVTYEIIDADYTSIATGIDRDDRVTGVDIAIQNPPYAKLSSSSPVRTAVRSIGTDAPNLYAAFLALATDSLKPDGQLVAITPRSFCNGPYFAEFRSNLLERLALDRIHVFESRSSVFADAGVLQENLIIAGTRDGVRDHVLLSSSDGHDSAVVRRTIPYQDVIHREDSHKFIRVMSKDEDLAVAEHMLSLPSTVESLGVTVSTGRVVDFRAKNCLLCDPPADEDTDGAVPLVYPVNVRDGQVTWPCDTKKAQWFRAASANDEKVLLPEGWYCVVKRFSAKEERRRIVAAVWSPERVPGPVAFENHLNVFHVNGNGMDRDTACGLSLWLNSSLVEQFFRTFSGHTQVNATDLRTLRFPSLEALRRLGRAAPLQRPGQSDIDSLVDSVLGVVGEVA